MLNNFEVKAAAAVVDRVLNDILIDHNDQPRKHEQVKLIASMIQNATGACTDQQFIVDFKPLFGK